MAANKEPSKTDAPKITAMYKVAYSYQHETGALRSSAMLIRADSPAGARQAAIQHLAKDYDWFKIGKIQSADSDHPQTSL